MLLLPFHRLSLSVTRRLLKTPAAATLSTCTCRALSKATTSTNSDLFGLTPVDVQMKRSRPNNNNVDESTRSALKRKILLDESTRNDLAYSLAFASSSSSSSSSSAATSNNGFTFHNFASLAIDDRMKQQLRCSKDQLRRHRTATTTTTSLDPKDVIYDDDDMLFIQPTLDRRPLPRTLQDACRPTRRAVVITEAASPFRVFDVNHAWEELCGYTFVESVGKTLGSLLAGPETDSVAATALITQLMRGEQEVGTTLTNYTKEGRRFRNRIRVGPLEDEKGQVTHFVGILQEVRD